MNGRGDQVLSHAGLAAEQDVGVGAGADFDQAADRANGDRPANHGLVDFSDGRFDRFGGHGRLASPGGFDPGQQWKDVLVVERFGQEVEGPEFPRLDRQGDAAVGRHDDYLGAREAVLLDAF